MSQRYLGGVITANPTTPTLASLSGVWTLEQQFQNFNVWSPKIVGNSVRFRSSASANLQRTFVSSNRKTWTWSGWVKRGLLANRQGLFSAGLISGTFHYHTIHFDSNDKLNVVFYPDTTSTTLITTQVFRDPSAWYHLVVAFDTTQATAANRVKVYVNGSQVTAFDTASYSAQNTDGYINSTTYNSGIHYIGRFTPSDTAYLDGYLGEINFIDGQALTPSSFGALDSTGVWQPLPYTGTYGTNGFYLTFSDNSAATAAALGKDTSGNGNNWTPNNISLTAGVTYDWMLDSPTNWTNGTGNGVANYCVLNPLSTAQFTLSNANLNWSITSSASNALYLRSTLAMSSGKWYWEVTPTDVGAGPNLYIGIQDATYTPSSSTTDNVTSGYAYKFDGNKVTGATSTAYGSSWTNNDVIAIALDMDAGTITFYKNNTSQGIAFSSLSGSYLPLIMHNVGGISRTTAGNVNFGQRPFTYTPPTGFRALNTLNLPDPTIMNGAQYIAATTYTGNGTSQSISNAVNGVSMQPDLVWTKIRSASGNHNLMDSVRGTSALLQPNSTAAEASNSNAITAFNSGGFSVGSDFGSNNNGSTYVGWQWQAGKGVTSSNTNGSITSTTSVSTTAGFSVLRYTGTGANATVGHGLGVAPRMIIVKNRSIVDGWVVYHASLTSAAYFLQLNTTAAESSNSTVWNSTAPNSTVFGVGSSTNSNGNGNNLVAYCFVQIAGYSAFGSYTGNGSTDGPFVFCGFRPRFVLVKSATGTAGNWIIWDTARDDANVTDNALFANLSNAESAGVNIDILSNGFKIRDTSTSDNQNAATYIFAAFAENPFKIARAR